MLGGQVCGYCFLSLHYRTLGGLNRILVEVQKPLHSNKRFLIVNLWLLSRVKCLSIIFFAFSYLFLFLCLPVLCTHYSLFYIVILISTIFMLNFNYEKAHDKTIWVFWSNPWTLFKLFLWSKVDMPLFYVIVLFL